jgi:hypothetical protein
VGAVRRYTKNKLKKILRGSGFYVKRISYWNMFLFPLFLTVALLDRTLDDRSRGLSTMDKESHPFINRVFNMLLCFESWLIGFIELPFGASIVAVCSKEE